MRGYIWKVFLIFDAIRFSQAQFLGSSRRADHVYIKNYLCDSNGTWKIGIYHCRKIVHCGGSLPSPFGLKELKGICTTISIRQWKKNWQTYQASTNPSECIDQDDSIWVEREDVYQHLHAFFEAQRDLERLQSDLIEAMRFAPDFMMENSRALRRRVERFVFVSVLCSAEGRILLRIRDILLI